MPLLLLCLAIAVRASVIETGGRFVYALDAYIHVAMAKNFARHGIWGCMPFHFSSSSSSILWTFLLSLGYLMFGVREAAPLALNILFAVVTLVVADRYLARLLVPWMLRLATLVGLAIAFPLTGTVLLGMEHILHLLLTIWFAGAAVEALTEPLTNSSARRSQCGTLCVVGDLLGASRYEGFS